MISLANCPELQTVPVHLKHGYLIQSFLISDTKWSVISTGRNAFYHAQVPGKKKKSNHMSKPAKWCVLSKDSDHSAHSCSLISVFAVRCEEALGSWLPIEHQAKTLIRLHGCAGWSVSLWDAHLILFILSCAGWNTNGMFQEKGSIKLVTCSQSHFTNWKLLHVNTLKHFILVCMKKKSLSLYLVSLWQILLE